MFSKDLPQFPTDIVRLEVLFGASHFSNDAENLAERVE